jgi:hypothetical protein
MKEHPNVFISYSHDSPDHKQWVSELGTRLRRDGVDVILDQWDLGPGDDMTRFMEVGVRDSDRVLVICTNSYVRKANAGEGGVGYERLIVTAQLVQDLGTNRFIPIIRQASEKEKTPTFLGTRVYIDFTDDTQFDDKFKELLHELHAVPIMQKPPLGKNPFAKLPSGQEAPPSEGLSVPLPPIPEQVESASHAYSAAIEIARAADVLGWRQLLKRIRPSFKSLVQWRQNELDGKQPGNKEQLVQVVNKAVDIVSPLISVALAGVESGREQFKDQKSLLDDLLDIAGWNRAGYEIWNQLPKALGYVYHSLHGALGLNTNQLDLALSLARVRIPVANGTKFLHVWERSSLMGWSKSLSGTVGGNCVEGWSYLAKAYERWDWLSLIFADDLEYRTSLVAYYMALNIHELASIIASGRQDVLNTCSETHLNVPLSFVSEGSEINKRATSLLLRNPEALMELWTSLNVTREQMEDSWENWIQCCESWLRDVYRFLSPREVPHQNLFEIL